MKSLPYVADTVVRLHHVDGVEPKQLQVFFRKNRGQSVDQPGHQRITRCSADDFIVAVPIQDNLRWRRLTKWSEDAKPGEWVFDAQRRADAAPHGMVIAAGDFGCLKQQRFTVLWFR